MACITDTDSIDLSVTGGQLSADVKLDPDTTNLLSVSASGLLVQSFNAFTAGMIVPYGGDTAPPAWLLCDGSAVSRSTYANLFSVLGTRFGVGDGSTTFNVPDTRGRLLAGWASAGHVDMDTIGENDGTALVNRRPRHRHTPHRHEQKVHPFSYTTGGTAGQDLGGALVSNSIFNELADGGSGVAADPLDGPAYLVVNHIVKI